MDKKYCQKENKDFTIIRCISLLKIIKTIKKINKKMEK